jgi:hypothetical protein
MTTTTTTAHPMADGGAPRVGAAELLRNQRRGIRDRRSKILIYRGGYRSGKTGFLVAKAFDLGCEHWPHPVLAVEPSYTMIRSVFVEAAMRLCSLWRLRCHYSVSRKVLTIGDRNPVEIWCRSADKPRSLEGLTVGSLVGDEWELWPIESLKVAMARVSVGPLQQIVLGGTPEGYGPGYRLLEEKRAPGTRVIISRTTDNRFVMEQNPDYANDLRSRLSESEASEKIEGLRMAPEGRVFTRFDAAVHGSFAAADAKHGRIEVWCGFVEKKMVWAFVLVDLARAAFHICGEIVTEHTDSQAQSMKALHWLQAWFKEKGNRDISIASLRDMRIHAQCDAEGQNRTERAPRTHLVNLQEVAGFITDYPRKNPSIEDRVATTQKALAELRLTTDPKAAPFFTRCLAQLRKGDDGKPERDGDLEHGAHVIGNGVMWHKPSTRPATAFEEQRSAQLWAESKRKGSQAPQPPHMLRLLPQLLLNRMAKAGRHSGNAVRDLGCSIPDFARHIEKQFTDGMTWENFGVRGWQLDHIRPLASFDLMNREQFKLAAHFSNYQPLWAHENKKKGVKWDGGLG